MILFSGMKCQADAWSHGHQTFLTPTFKRHGTKQLSPVGMMITTVVARDRACNERMVKRPCSFGFVKKKLRLNQRLDIANSIWMNICFRVNFVFRPLWLPLLIEWENN